MNRWQILHLVAELSVKCSYYSLVLMVFNRHPQYLIKLENRKLSRVAVIMAINKGEI